MRKRFLPTSTTHVYTTSLNNARNIPYNTNKRLLNVEVSKNSPFNPKLNEPVKVNITAQVNSKKLAPVKGQITNPGNSANVALYDIRGEYTVNAENVLGSPIMAQKLINDKRERIQLQTDARQYAYNPSEHVYNIARVGESGISFKSNSYCPNKTNVVMETYNPMLPESETNKRPANLPVVPHERMDRKRNERAYLLPSDQANLALNLLHSEETKLRRKRQEDMQKAMLKETGINRWIDDNNKVYLRAQDAEKPTVDALDTGIKRKIITEYDTIGQREEFEPQDYHAVNRLIDIQHEFNKNNDRQMQALFTEYQKKASKEFFNGEEETTQRGNKNIVETIASAVLNVLGINSTKEHYRNTWENNRTPYGDCKCKEDKFSDFIKENFQFMSKGTKPVKLVINRDYNKPIVMDITDEYDNKAASYIMIDDPSADVLNLKRTMTYVQDGKFIVIQQLESDRVLGSDTNPMQDDFLLTVVPLEELNEDFRIKLNILNPLMNERAQNLKLTYKDYEDIIEWLDHSPDKTQRTTLKQIAENVRSFDYERDIRNSFENNTDMFITVPVKNKMVDTIRHKIQDKMKGRIEPAAASANTGHNTEEVRRINTKKRNENIKAPIQSSRTVNPNKNRFKDLKYNEL